MSFLKTPALGLSEIALIELDCESNRPEQDPCDCDILLIRSSRPPRLPLSAPVSGFMSKRDPGPPGSLSAAIMAEQCTTQSRVCRWLASKRAEVTLILFVTYHIYMLLFISPVPSPCDLLPLAALHLGGVVYRDG